MKPIRKFILSTPIFFPFLTTVVLTSCQTNNKKINDVKTIEDTKRDKKYDEWNSFLKYEYIDALLNLVFDNNKEEKAEYIKNQMNISDDYLKTIKEYLMYANNVTSTNLSDDRGDKKVIPISEFRVELSKLFTKNWLWFFFNLNKFTIAFYNSFNQFSAPLETLSLDVQKNSLELGPFNKPQTNEVLQYVIQSNENSEDYKKEYTVYLLTKEGIILQITISKELDSNNKIITSNPKVSIYSYSFIYPSIFNNQDELKNFSLLKYVQVHQIYEKIPGKSAIKILFDDDFGGEPLRFTIVDVDTNTNK
ncbi:aromatic motif membrane protein [Mycoplasma tauri]|uniref:aromatic motif membrane protein n=1 Tax=Mycoplasma tauri TaxID=547987 RepID=UPI001CBB0844|nr:aromatic motif membrane protein [Mycoplasma tauri]MBZ4203847.1 hypothetical protein [Mycoplasma tauri]